MASPLVPEVVTQLVLDYVTARDHGVTRAVDLWADGSDLVDRLAERLVGVDATGLVAEPRSPLPRRRPVADVATHVARPGTPYDLVLGVPPWGWVPRPTVIPWAGRDLEICDDPANVAIVRACDRLHPRGVGIFVVAPGFIARPGRDKAFPVLRSMGIGLEALIGLPRGAFRPDTGSGRFLVALSPSAGDPPRTAVLNADGTGCEQLLAGMRAVLNGA